MEPVSTEETHQATSNRPSLEDERLYGPLGVRWPALVSAIVIIGVIFAPVGAVLSAIIAYFANHPVQVRWRNGFIILTAVFLVCSFAGFFLLKPGDGEKGPLSGKPVSGLIAAP